MRDFVLPILAFVAGWFAHRFILNRQLRPMEELIEQMSKDEEGPVEYVINDEDFEGGWKDQPWEPSPRRLGSTEKQDWDGDGP